MIGAQARAERQELDRAAGRAYGSRQSISPMMYGDSRTFIGAGACPRGRRPGTPAAPGRRATRELLDAGDAVAGLELVVAELLARHVPVGRDVAPEFVVEQIAVGVFLGVNHRLEGRGHLDIHQLGQQVVVLHSRQDVADPGADGLVYGG